MCLDKIVKCILFTRNVKGSLDDPPFIECSVRFIRVT